MYKFVSKPTLSLIISSRLQMFFKIGVLKISQENICVESLFHKVTGLEACNFD